MNKEAGRRMWEIKEIFIQKEIYRYPNDNIIYAMVIAERPSYDYLGDHVVPNSKI